jgi:hypothetical protein
LHTQLLETLVQRQYVNQKMPHAEGRPMSKRRRMMLARL